MCSKFFSSRIYAGEEKQLTMLINTLLVHTFVESEPNGMEFSLLIWLCYISLTSPIQQMWMAPYSIIIIIINVLGVVRHLYVTTSDCQSNGNLPGIVSQIDLTSSPSSSKNELVSFILNYHRCTQ